MEAVSSSKDETALIKAEPRRSRKRRNTCLAAIAVVGVLVLIPVILCFTVFKAKEPKTTVDGVVLRDLQVALNMPKLSVDLNLTLDVNLSVKNPNKVGFKYSNSTAFLSYRGELVGEAHIAAGRISADRTKPMNVTLTIMADRLLGKSKLFSDVLAGTLPFNTLTTISGKVIILGFIKIHATSTASCDFNVNVSNATAGDQVCKYKTKL